MLNYSITDWASNFLSPQLHPEAAKSLPHFLWYAPLVVDSLNNKGVNDPVNPWFNRATNGK